MKYKAIALWLSIFGLLFAFLQTFCKFHFYYIEQNQLFQQTIPYILEKGLQSGGVALVISEYLVQFFLTPYMGALITSLLMLSIGILTQYLIKQIAPNTNFWGLYLLPVILFLFIHFDFNYQISGTVSYLIMMIFLVLIIRVKDFKFRLTSAILATIALYFLAGSICILFAVTFAVIEYINKPNRVYLSLFVPAVGILLAIGSVYFSIQGEYRFAFLPDCYYHNNLTPPNSIYFSWLSLLSTFLFVSFFRKRETLGRNRSFVEHGIQLICIIGLCWWGIPKYLDLKSAKLKELDYYYRMEQWGNILELCQGSQNNYLYLCYANMALAHKGELADKMFSYDQRGIQGISVPWNKSTSISTLLSDVFFAMSHIASSQEMAFESYVSSTGDGNPRMMKRLIQTNLIYGYYPVAEKYINILENTFSYKDWAQSHRKFLYNDVEVEKDLMLGLKRKSLFNTTSLSMIDGIEHDLQRIAEHNPSDRSAIEYLGAIHLLSKDIQSFQKMIDTYYGTPVLPQLPKSFQEAIIILSEKEPQKWKQYNISESIINRFYEFKKQIIANKNNSNALPNLIRNSHGDTYWFYFMFKQ